MEQENKEIPISINIKKIRELGFSIDVERDISQHSIVYSIEMDTNIRSEKDEVELVMSAHFKVEGEENTFLSIKIGNTFYVEEITRFIGEEKSLNLPEDIWIIIVSLSFSHTRALLARSTNGTPFEWLMLPIIDPKTLI